jgi:CubicO group peptidase (beta-lactamase class C family)
MVEAAASLPLLAQPGAEWNYSIATDVLGHLVAVISGQSFERFLRERVIEPLGMIDTDFHVPPEKIGRFAANYAPGDNGSLKLIDDARDSRDACARAGAVSSRRRPITCGSASSC